MKRTLIIAFIAWGLFLLSFLIPSVTYYKAEPPVNTWPYIETQPVPSVEPIKDIEILTPILKPAETPQGTPQDDRGAVILAQTTAYNTDPLQTDSTPCISASGDDICGRTDVVACPNHLPFGTMVEIGEATYVCLDRTHAKYGNRFDISFDKDYQGAVEYGVQTRTVVVLKM